MDGGGGGGGYRGGGRNNYHGGGGGGGHHNKRKFQGGGGGDHQQQRYSQQRRDADEGGDGTRPLLAKLIKCADVPRVSKEWDKKSLIHSFFFAEIGLARFFPLSTFPSSPRQHG